MHKRQLLSALRPLRAVMAAFRRIVGRLSPGVSRRTRQDLMRSEARLDRAVRGSGEGLWDLDLVSGELYLSMQFKSQLGFDEHELESTPAAIRALIHPDDLAAVEAATKAHLEEKAPFQIEFRVRARSGEYRWYQSRGEALRDEAGVPVCFSGLFSDITVRKQARERLQAYTKELEQSQGKILEQTEMLALQAIELADARDQALAATRAKSTFLACMSHEIRTPMNGVIGMTSLLLDTELTPEQREQGETIRVSAESLLTIINDILDYSKIEAGKLTLETVDFDLRATVEDAIDLIADAARRKGLALGCLIDPAASGALTGDPGRIRQILLNLLSNAVKFTSHGEVVLRVEPEGSDGHVLRFSVADTGIGIPAAAQSRLFESFSQAETSTARRYGGTGLGLAISKQLAELMGGKIGVKSTPGNGSTFWFTARLDRAATRAAEDSLPAHLQNVHVLVVDQEPVNRAILQSQLTQWGAHVFAVDSARSAITEIRVARSRSMPYSLVIMDERLADVDGLSLCEWIKADDSIQHTPLVLSSASPQRGSTERARRLGFAGYLSKPIRQRALWHVAKDALSLSTRPDADAAPALQPIGPNISARVLVADDVAVNQKVSARMLEKLGCRVDVVSDGKEALEMLANVPYDLVFMDCHMPHMDGFEATARIREREGEGKRTPIIALTASAMVEDRERCLAAGMDDHLAKPLNQAQLRAALERWTLAAREKGSAQRSSEAA